MKLAGALRLAGQGALLVGLAALYFAAAKLGLSLGFSAEQVSAVWPPTGIALAAVILFGTRVWPAISIGAFLANVTAAEPVATACGIAAGNTLEALCGAWLLRQVGFRARLERVWDVLALVGLAGAISTCLSATIGVANLCLGSVQPWAAFPSLWRVWWVGDAMGNLVVAPLLLAWAELTRLRFSWRRSFEALTLLVTLATVSAMVFTEQLPLLHIPRAPEYLVFPFVIWAAVRFGQTGATAVTFIVSAVAIGSTVQALGPFAIGPVADESLVLLQGFLAVLAVTGLLLGAAIRERDFAERRRAASNRVTQILAETSTLGQATPRVLRTICEALQWDVGGMWVVDAEREAMRCVEIHSQAPERFAEFEAASRSRSFGPGIGLPGRVLASAEPAWIPDVVTDRNFPRAPIASRSGLHGALGFPILVRGEVFGMLEFFSSEIRQPDEDLLRLLGNVGSQIGQFLERARVEEAVRMSEERLRLALAAGRMGVWDWNVVTGEMHWSSDLEGIHGLMPGRFAGTFDAFLQLVHPDDRDEVQRAITRTLEHGQPYEIEYRSPRSDGSLRWIAGRGKIMGGGEGPSQRMLGVGMDVTSRRRLEEELRDQARQLMEADQRKNEFLAMLAHELRNPLAPITNVLELLRMRLDATAVEQARTMIERQVKHMVRLVDDLLDVSRITRGKIALRIEDVDLARIVADAVAANRPLIDARRQVLAVSLPPEPVRLRADETRLSQVLSNLLNNAAKYTGEGGRLSLTVARESGDVVLKVRDSGMGMTPEVLERAFDLFAQGEPAAERTNSGLGVGLTLARRLVELHGGSITAHSAGPGRGSEFTIRLPVSP